LTSETEGDISVRIERGKIRAQSMSEEPG